MFQRNTLVGDWSTDTLDGRIKSLDGNNYAQVFVNKGYCANIYISLIARVNVAMYLKYFVGNLGFQHI